jgi:hypothetical protein
MTRATLWLGLVLASSVAAGAQDPFDGQTLISPMMTHDAHLLDMDGSVLKTWHGSDTPTSMAYLMSDGSILRPCDDACSQFPTSGAGGRIQRIDVYDNIVWDYLCCTEDYKQHHDIEPLPGGNILAITRERRSHQEALDAGRAHLSGELWPTLIIEIQPSGTTGGVIVWEWHAWDHLIQDVDPAKPNYGVVADHPELIDINFGAVGGPGGEGDWIHANAIDYHEEFDQIVFSSRRMNEFYVIDHSTTTEEAAGHTGGNSGMGGDILYRWGNPSVYGRPVIPYFYVLHGANWVDPGLPGAGNILAFNNGDRYGTANDYSTVAEIVPPVDEFGNYYRAPGAMFGPPEPTWIFEDPAWFYSGPTQGGAYRLPNGNTLICSTADGYVFEVTQAGSIVWDYDHPGMIARAERYWDIGVAAPFASDLARADFAGGLRSGPNPFTFSTTLRFFASEGGPVEFEIFTAAGRRVALLRDRSPGPGELRMTWNGSDERGRPVPAGVYFVRLKAEGITATRKMMLFR